MKETALSGIDRIALMQTFVLIVEAGTLSAAALRLETSQPTVSRRLQSLERLLGVKLLQRTTHVMKLTDDGERCFAHAKALVEQWQAIEDDLQGAAEEPKGLLRVLVPHAFGQDQMIGPLQEYLQRYPKMRVEWMLSDRRPDFIAEGVDCAVHVGTVTDPSVVALLVAEIPRIVVAAPQLLASGLVIEHPAGLAELPWVALSTFYRQQVTLTSEQQETQHIAIRPQLLTDSLYALRNAMLAGMGVGIASSWAVKEDIEQGRLQHLCPAWHAAPLPIYLVYPYARFYPAKLRRFLEMMREVLPIIGGTQAPVK
ncbi:LysR family transcriptional regulator [Erwinia sp. MMLR14_017]|uniref:LysR family transcriptional regulator n=1 Tax=Erwinia sp. MMLR14_017 TaxID=3093842 RepID=UPI00298F765A|nr:LysR family transcriptional regulator [Erwinia sp. MMLR14_017]MDW8845494.1 LysR family transcriptional regulator [Erwinia sp. MMLR14_017]